MTDLSNAIKVVDRKSSKGVPIEIWVRIDWSGVTIESRIDGQRDAEVSEINTRIPDSVRASGFAGVVGRIGVTADEVAAIEAAMVTAQSQYESTPDGLREMREGLVDDLRSLLSAESETRNGAWERDDVAGAFQTPSTLSDAITAARKAIADFDAAHPEVLADHQKERTDRSQAHTWD